MAAIVLPGKLTRQPQYPAKLAAKYKSSAEFVSLLNHASGVDLAKNNTLAPLAGAAWPVLVTRPQGIASYFNAQYLDTTNPLTITSAFTVFAWVRPDTLNTGYTRILETRYDAGFYLGSNTASQYAFIVNNSALEGCVGGQQVVGQRDFVCAVFDNGNISLYVNGVLVASSTATTPSSGLGFRIGYSNAGGVFAWSGDIDTVGVFNRAFQSREIAGLYANPWQMLRAQPKRLFFVAASGSVGSSSGSSIVSGVGASDNAQPASASGAASVSGVGASLFSGVGSSNGAATVSGVGAVAGSSGSASGIASVSGVGASLVDSVGSANGVASLSGIGASESASVASAAGVASVSGVGDSSSAGSSVGSASGSSSVSGVGASESASVGSAGGVSSATGISSRQGGETFSGGFPEAYRSRKDREEHKKKQRIALGIVEDDEAPESSADEIADVKEAVAIVTKARKLIPARLQKKIDKLAEQEEINAELKRYIKLELDREEETIIRMLMEL